LGKAQLLLTGFQRARPANTRLRDFDPAFRLGPVAALILVSAAIYLAQGMSPTLRMLLALCAAYAAASLPLTCLAWLAGPNAAWRLIVPTAGFGVVLGGYAAAAVAHAPALGIAISWPPVRNWQIGAAFSTFFVGLALVAAAVRQGEQAELETRERLLEAKLKMLTARIEPHFLMNTLANLRVLIKSNPTAAYELLDDLTELLQGALERSKDLRSTLGEELRLIESYLRIMQVRMGKRLSFEIDVPERLRATPIPALMLHTLVENAIRHGIDPADHAGRISIRATDDDGWIRLSITDDGVGFEVGKQSPGVGLRNVQERLDSFYRGDATLAIVSRRNGGTEATVTLPRLAA
jgi:signal transduction histidine kinase